jgi:hypothetical protein
LKYAASRGHSELELLRLDGDAAYAPGIFFRGYPAAREHLKSPAYQKLWDHLVKHDLAPFTKHQEFWSILGTPLFVRLPD